MPHYNPQIAVHAKRKLESLPDEIQDKLVETIQEVSTYRKITHHPKCELLNGTNKLYKVRVGEYRAILTLEKPDLRVMTVGHRSTVYEHIDELHAMT